MQIILTKGIFVLFSNHQQCDPLVFRGSLENFFFFLLLKKGLALVHVLWEIEKAWPWWKTLEFKPHHWSEVECLGACSVGNRADVDPATDHTVDPNGSQSSGWSGSTTSEHLEG